MGSFLFSIYILNSKLSKHSGVFLKCVLSVLMHNLWFASDALVETLHSIPCVSTDQ